MRNTGIFSFLPGLLQNFILKNGLKVSTREMRPAHALPAEYLLGYKMEPTFLVLHLQTDDPFLYGGVGCRLASLQLEIVIELTFPC